MTTEKRTQNTWDQPVHKVDTCLESSQILTRMKTPHALLVAIILGLSPCAQSMAATPDNWGPTKYGVRVSLTLDKLSYALGEEIPLHIAAQVVSAERTVYGEADAPEGAFWKAWIFSRAFHLTITDEDDVVVGNKYSSNLQLLWSGSSGLDVCPEQLEIGHVYMLEQTANRHMRPSVGIF